MARILVQATLPHSRPKTHEFERVNGRFTLYMNAPPSVGLPYGSYPRLALAWLSTEAEGHAAGGGYTIAHKHELWWSPRDPEQRPLWNSVVILSSEVYDELVAHAVPIDLRALKALKGSPLALDIYSWLTYRMSYLRRPCLIPWEALHAQFGADYGRLGDFKRKFLGHLSDVLHVYPRVRISEQPAGLLLRPSPTHLPRVSGGGN
jgi:hypothetical protein